jgi:hypothetical protein
MQALAIAYPDDVTQASDFQNMFIFDSIILLAGFSIQHWNCQCYNVRTVFFQAVRRLLISPFSPPVRNTKGFPLYLVTWVSKPHVASCLRWPPRHSQRTPTVRQTVHPIHNSYHIRTIGYSRTGRPPFGASHGTDVFELFGFNNQTDFITADAFSENSLFMIPKVPS